jgi:hypothetical protein
LEVSYELPILGQDIDRRLSGGFAHLALADWTSTSGATDDLSRKVPSGSERNWSTLLGESDAESKYQHRDASHHQDKRSFHVHSRIGCKPRQ